MKWRAEYSVEVERDHRKQTRYYTPDGAECSDCPVSYITPDSWMLVNLFTQAATVRKGTGIQTLSELIRRDARVADAAAVIEECRADEYTARLAEIQRK